MADEHCDKWAQKLAARFGDALYATGETSLAQAALDALLKKRRLLVATDETTGRLVGALLRPLKHSEAAFDFGTQTYADPVSARKIITPPACSTAFPAMWCRRPPAAPSWRCRWGRRTMRSVTCRPPWARPPLCCCATRRGAVACAVKP